ncbi:MAG: hypothetical protein IKN19_07235, partial [Bacteroidaceae bacterium]|nr:hypothetical protein [Bacteroidaceae bacterium]
AGKCVNTSMGRGYAMVSTANDIKMTWAGNEKVYGITNTGSWLNTALHEGGGTCLADWQMSIGATISSLP